MLSTTVSFLQKRFQDSFLPFVEKQVDEPLLERHRKILWALEIIQIEKELPKWVPFSRGRPPKDHSCIARAFIAKHVLNLPTTNMLIHMLNVDKHLRYLCGWDPGQKIPSESKFCRVFQTMVELNIPERIHERLTTDLLKEEVVPHAVTDSMPIAAKERPAKKKRREKVKTGKDTVCYQQAYNDLTVTEMLNFVPTECTTGRKVKSNGNNICWNGYKLHACMAEGRFILGAAISSASTNDNQVAIPLLKMTSSRTNVLYDLMDTAYDVEAIHLYSASLGRVPIIKEHKRRGKRNEDITQERKARKALGWQPAEAIRLKSRAIGERVFARLTAGFSTLNVFVRGYKKVKTHVMLSILAHTVDELDRCPT